MTINTTTHHTDAVSGRLIGLSVAFIAGMAVVAVPIVFVVAPRWEEIAHGYKEISQQCTTALGSIYRVNDRKVIEMEEK